jgi:hypothetical protein
LHRSCLSLPILARKVSFLPLIYRTLRVIYRSLRY